VPSSLTAEPEAPRILALDTCLHSCQAAILRGDETLASLSEPMTRGHQERLALMTREAMGQAGLAFPDLSFIAVTVGPGSFTGLRVGLAFAKGLALALDRPCIGIGVLEALAAGPADSESRAAVIDAGRGRVYMQIFSGDQAVAPPDVFDISVAQARLGEAFPSGHFTLVGPGARLLADAWAGAHIDPLAAPDPVAVGRLALQGRGLSATPIYLRAPDAIPKAGLRLL
jgi:tRNA threonylcarbamoyladenosine biosynthesis protein TsaB